MSNRKLIPLRDPAEIPRDMTEQQAREFWSSHEVPEEYLERAGPIPDDALPQPSDRTRTIPLRVDAEMLRRIKVLASRRRRTPQALLKQAVAEWLAAAEERERAVSSG
jgi:hypothetical protein